MVQDLFKTYIKKALLVLTAMALCLGFTLLPSDSHALVDSPVPYLVKDINPGDSSSSLGGLTDVNGTLFFSPDDGEELWKSDGTGAGTVMVKYIYPGGGDNLWGLTDVNGTLFFSAYDDVHGRELWKSDGTDSGTVMVKDINPELEGSGPWELTDVNGKLFFRAYDGVHGVELCKSDGTSEGTVMVKDIDTGGDSSSPGFLIDVNGKLFFSAEDDVHGRELWKSDGTEVGTVMVKDIWPGSEGGFYPDDDETTMTNVNGTLFFRTDDGVHGYELWKSDGTPEGTVMVKDIYEGSGGGLYPYDYPGMTEVNGTLFFSANDGVHGWEMWKSDGTGAGTVMVKDIWPGSED